MKEKKFHRRRRLNKKKILLLAMCVLILIFIIFKLSSKSLKISLNGPETIDLDYGATYSEQFVQAYYGKKDISNNVEISGNVDTSKIGTYTITYTAKQKKKTKSVTRTINVKDTAPPTITLNGKDEINIAQGSTYRELGCYANDNYDKDITTKISIENTIDTSKKGTYTVNYSVKDSSGNTSTASRTVNVVESGSKNISTEKATRITCSYVPFLLW